MSQGKRDDQKGPKAEKAGPGPKRDAGHRHGPMLGDKGPDKPHAEKAPAGPPTAHFRPWGGPGSFGFPGPGPRWSGPGPQAKPPAGGGGPRFEPRHAGGPGPARPPLADDDF